MQRVAAAADMLHTTTLCIAGSVATMKCPVHSESLRYKLCRAVGGNHARLEPEPQHGHAQHADPCAERYASREHSVRQQSLRY